jgi:hypothetical protein
MLDMRCRALFYLWKVPRGNAVIVVDRDGPVSVTNDAEKFTGFALLTPAQRNDFFNEYSSGTTP